MDIRYDYSKLRGLIRERLRTEGEFARRIGRSQNYITKVFNNQSYLNHKDIATGAEILGIPKEDIGIYFFTKEVHKNETFPNEDRQKEEVIK